MDDSAFQINNVVFLNIFCFNLGTAILGFGLRNIRITKNNVTAVNIITNIQLGMPVVCDILAFTFVGLLILFIKGNRIPALVIVADKAYIIKATQLPINPSPARYHVPVAHPPANTIPIPNTNEPIIVILLPEMFDKKLLIHQNQLKLVSLYFVL